jgi:hypothetical protein
VRTALRGQGEQQRPVSGCYGTIGSELGGSNPEGVPFVLTCEEPGGHLLVCVRPEDDGRAEEVPAQAEHQALRVKRLGVMG